MMKKWLYFLMIFFLFIVPCQAAMENGFISTATSDLDMGTYSIDGDSSDGLVFDFNNDNTNNFVGLANGNTGIGTINPAYELEVDGDVYADSFIADGNIGTLKTITYQDDDFKDDGYIGIGSKHEEILENPEFEGTYVNVGTNIDIAPNWLSRNLDIGSDTASKETTIVQSGSASQHVVANAANEGIYRPWIDSPQNTRYRFSCWIYIPSAGVGGTVRARINESGDDYTDYLQLDFSTQDVWVNLQGEFLDSDNSSQFEILITAQAGAAEWYVDDVTLTVITASSGQGTVSCGVEKLDFVWKTDGSVGGYGTTNVALTDSDTDLCAFDNGINPIIRNRLGSTCEVRVVTWFE